MKPTRIVATALVAALPVILGCSDEAETPTELSDTPLLSRTAPPAANLVAPLAGSQEVPPVATHATGVAKFQLSKDGTELSYKLIVANVENVTQAHIHLGPRGANGGVVAFLFGFVSGGVTQNGILAEGVITASNLIGALGGQSLTDLLDEAARGNAYVNVHTAAHPGGEIRGQILVGGPDS
jgi:hypothetical protein